MTQHPITNATPATEQNGNSNVDSWIQLANGFLQTIKALAKSNSDANKSDGDTQEKGGNERTSAYHAGLTVALSGSVLACEALADPLAFVSREFARAIAFLVRQARRDVLENLWMCGHLRAASNRTSRSAALRMQNPTGVSGYH